jgi:hypothetical protein
MRAKSLLASVVALGAGCGLFPSLGELSGDAGEVTAIDGSFDTGASDASTTSFCSTQDAMFCDDFDQDDGSLALWPARNTATCASLTLVASDAPPPNAASFTVGAGTKSCSVGKVFTATASTRMYYSFMLFVAQLSPSGANISPIKPAGTSNGGTLYVNLNATSSFTEGLPTQIDAGPIAHPLAVAVPMMKWAHVEITIAITPTPTAQVSIDGALALGPTQLSPTFAFAAPEIVAGISYQGPSGTGTSIAIDNVVFDYE